MIEINGFNKKYGLEEIFVAYTLKVETGECVGIYGPSGCGKTTLLQCISGLDEDYTGEIRLDGRVMEAKVKPHQRKIAMVMQDAVLWPHMKVKDNILFAISRTHKKEKEVLLESICTKLGIVELLEKYPQGISGGQAKRVSLARAIIADKDVLLLDEPLNNVDQDTRDTIVAYLKQECVPNKTVIYVSHDRAELEMICTRIEEL